ncbi:MAG TPA: hypothetical protein VFW33_19560 [Gemmataceae bacterium]|nr:hypothetical protein [Gemmataceae bacterium]
MFGRLRLRAWEIDSLTETELVLALDDDLESKRDPAGGKVMGAADIVEYARRWRGQTLAERLRRAREG